MDVLLIDYLSPEDLESLKKYTLARKEAADARRKILTGKRRSEEEKIYNPSAVSILLILNDWESLGHMSKEEKIQSMKHRFPISEKDIRLVFEKIGLE